MSAVHAYTPTAPRLQPQAEPRHIRIVTTQAQRTARPRAVSALVTVVGLFTIFMAQLLLSIVTSDGAYQIASLQSQQRSLAQEEQALNENLSLLGSQQNLAVQAESLGMVLGSTTPVFLRLSDGAIIGTPVPGGEGASPIGAAGSLVPNALLVDVPLVDATRTNATAPDAPGQGPGQGQRGTGQATADGVATSPGMLPSPVTR